MSTETGTCLFCGLATPAGFDVCEDCWKELDDENDDDDFADEEET